LINSILGAEDFAVGFAFASCW